MYINPVTALTISLGCIKELQGFQDRRQVTKKCNNDQIKTIAGVVVYSIVDSEMILYESVIRTLPFGQIQTFKQKGTWRTRFCKDGEWQPISESVYPDLSDLCKLIIKYLNV